MVVSKSFLDSTRRVVESWLECGMMVAKWLCCVAVGLWLSGGGENAWWLGRVGG